jgi:hypothetical protein
LCACLEKQLSAKRDLGWHIAGFNQRGALWWSKAKRAEEGQSFLEGLTLSQQKDILLIEER